MTKLRKAWLAVAVTAVITTMTGFIPAASAAPQDGKKISHIGFDVGYFLCQVSSAAVVVPFFQSSNFFKTAS